MHTREWLTRYNFREAVKERAPLLSEEAVGRAVAHYNRHHGQDGCIHRENIKACADLAQALEDPTGTEEVVALPPGPEMHVVAREHMEHLLPQVEALREALFGQPSPPFGTDDEGARWIQATAAEAERDMGPIRLRGPGLDPLHEQLDEIQSEVQRISGHQVGITFRAFLLEFFTGTPQEIDLISVRFDSPLARLAQGVDRWSEATAFSRVDLVRLVLCGVEPPPPPAATISRRHYGHPRYGVPRREEVRIHLHTPRATRRQLASVTDAAKTWWRASAPRRQYRVTANDRKALEIVEHLGGEPEDGKMEFWRRGAKAWAERFDETKSPGAFRKQWGRLQQKLEEAEGAQ